MQLMAFDSGGAIKVILKALAGIVQAAVWWAVSLPLGILGLAVVPLAIKYGKVQKDITGTKNIFSAPRWLWLWGNQQEGYDSPKSLALHPNMSTFKRRWLWAAWRNKTSNLRFIGLFKVDPSKVKSETKGNHTVSSYKWMCCWEWRRKTRFTKLGARLTQDWARYGTNFAVDLNHKY